MKAKGFKRTLAAAVTGVALMGSSMAAFGAPPQPDPTPKAPWVQGEDSRTGSITIHKYEVGDKINATNDGREIKGDALANQTKLNGVKYKVTKVTSIDKAPGNNVTLDLTKYKDWNELATLVNKLNKDPNSADVHLEQTSKECTTGDTAQSPGECKVDNLTIGFYKVEEIDVSKAKRENEQTLLSGLTKAAPFYMTLPMAITKDPATTADGDKTANFLYTTHIYPKNQVAKATKSFVDEHKGVTQPGDNVEYQVKATINSDNADTLKGFAIYDQPSTHLFAPVDPPAAVGNDNAAETVKKVEVLNKNGIVMQEQTFSSPDDYKVIYADSWSDKNATAPNKTVFVKFTDAGLKKLAAAKKADPKAEASVTFKFTLDPQTAAGTEVTNEGGFILGKATDPWGGNENDPEPPQNPEDTVPNDPSDDPSLKFDNFVLTKKDKATDKVLKGAEFYLFDANNEVAAKKCAEDAAVNVADCNKALKFGDNSAKKFITEQDGTFKQNLVNGVYYLVEVKAPANYILPFEPQKIDIKKTVGGNYNFTATAYNVSVASGDEGSWFTLPTTGSTGVVLIVLIGAALITAGAVIFFVASKRRKEEEAVA
ncbi:SpaH/EbpB family LPXTG-anchored major pilin [Arcanobacterium hippocoleae]|uniref:LPXTG-motif cell wall-anchored protein n=1 Tax=Arcanobacterium hippocoleae TaxID=149017 RepID=A0ABU1T3D5_9ACTO|nr:SpaH/EbpB family LPXTG-anchored major pilin [Arcanobacterium hippocoleae]MDR6939909.1 LPXTG-motif cell wall-anchored protein [Arcanobacterium hippocoleae]